MATHEPTGDWTVTDPYGPDHTFTSDVPAFAYALHNARTDRATIITAPGGDEQYLVMRVDPRVTIQAVRPLTPGGGS